MQIKPVSESDLATIVSQLRMPRGQLISLLQQAQSAVFHIECADIREANAKYASVCCTRNRANLRSVVALVKRGNSIYIGPYASLGLAPPVAAQATDKQTRRKGAQAKK